MKKMALKASASWDAKVCRNKEESVRTPVEGVNRKETDLVELNTTNQRVRVDDGEGPRQRIWIRRELSDGD